MTRVLAFWAVLGIGAGLAGPPSSVGLAGQQPEGQERSVPQVRRPVESSEPQVPDAADPDTSILSGTEGLRRAEALLALVSQAGAANPARTRRLGLEALEILEREGTAEAFVDGLLHLGRWASDHGGFDDAQTWAEGARQAALANDDPTREADALELLGQVAQRRGYPIEALVHLHDAQALREELHDAAALARVHQGIGFVQTHLGDYEAAVLSGSKALNLYEQLGDQTAVGRTLDHLGVLSTKLGEYEDADRHLARAEELLEAHGTRADIAWVWMHRGEVALDRGRGPRAKIRFQRALDLFQQAGERMGALDAQYLLAESLVLMGDLGGARAILEPYLAEVDALGTRLHILQGHRALGGLLLAEGDPQAAIAEYTTALELAAELGTLPLAAELYGARSNANEASGNLQAALEDHKRFKEASEEIVDQQKAGRLVQWDSRLRDAELEQMKQAQETERLNREKEDLTRNAVLIALGALMVLGLLSERRRTLMAREMTRQLAKAAVTDALTGLRNRRGFLEMAEHERARMRRAGHPGAIILLDIDRFKEFNDSHGHIAGDRVLESVGRILTSSAREEDVLARWGGEEFVMLLPDTTVVEAAKVAERLRGNFERQTHEVGGTRETVTITLGVAKAEWDHTIDEWIMSADTALYAGKASGRNRVVVAQDAQPLIQS